MSNYDLARERGESLNLTKALGEEPGWFWRWVHDPAAISADEDATEIAVLDALTQEGVPAWIGDAVSCVAQMIAAQVRRAEAAERRLKEAETLLAPLATYAAKLTGDNAVGDSCPVVARPSEQPNTITVGLLRRIAEFLKEKSNG